MSKAILLSIKPKYLADILNGKKTIEIRKTKPKCDLPIDVYIYCTKDNKNKLCYVNYEPCGNKGFLTTKLDCEGKELNGKVVAKFTLRKIEVIKKETESGFLTFTNNPEFYKSACIGVWDMLDYLGNSLGYAWHIEDLVIFDKPKELSEFKVLLKGNKLDHSIDAINMFNGIPLRKAPQSMCYINVE